MLSETNRDPTTRTLATAADYKGKTFKNKNLILFELWRANFEATGDVVIKDVSFENCHIDGPAILLPINGCVFDDVNFGTAHGDMRNLIVYPASPQRITGAIAMVGCKFSAVDFFAVGFTGGKDFLDSLLELPTREGLPESEAQP